MSPGTKNATLTVRVLTRHSPKKLNLGNLRQRKAEVKNKASSARQSLDCL